MIMEWNKIMVVFLCIIPSLLANNSLLLSKTKQKEDLVILKNNGDSTSGLEIIKYNSSCQLWTRPNHDNESCYCGDSIQGIVHCENRTLDVSLQTGFCMSYSESTHKTAVGYCIFTYIHIGYPFKIEAKENTDLNGDVCNSRQNFSRTGQLCGKCKEGYAPPVYSYSLACVECSDYKYNWLKYIAIAFLPVTVFYIIVIVFRVSVTSPAMIAYVLANQVIAIPSQVHFAGVSFIRIPLNNLSAKVLPVVYGIWNLDFLRGVFDPFCLHPKLSLLDTLLLDYALAIFPMFLIFITYLFVNLQDNSRAIRWCYRPVYKCFIKIRREWNIQSSLVSAFATFILLSYIKILDVTFQILTPTRLYDVNGDQLPQLYLYYNGTVEYFGEEHLPYAVLALFMFTVFNMFPLLLLCLYPCQCFQRCLNCCNIRWPSLHIFMDTFHGCYKLKPYDCRYFAAFYLALRIINYITAMLTTSVLYFPIITILFGISATVTGLTRPYKKHLYTIIDVIMLTYVTLIAATLTIIFYANTLDPVYILHSTSGIVALLEIGMLPLYGLSLFIYSVIPKRVRLRLKDWLYKFYHVVCNNRLLKFNGRSESEAFIEYFIEGETNDESFSPLIQVTVAKP